MLLVLHGAGPHGDVGQQIVQIAVVFGVEQLVGAGEARLPQGPQMQGAHRDDALVGVGPGRGVGLVDQAHVALAAGPWLIGEDPGHDEDLVLHPLRQLPQPAQVFQHAVGVVRRAGAHDQQAALVPALEERTHGPGPGVHDGLQLRRHRVELLGLHGDRQLPLKFQVHLHATVPPARAGRRAPAPPCAQ